MDITAERIFWADFLRTVGDETHPSGSVATNSRGTGVSPAKCALGG